MIVAAIVLMVLVISDISLKLVRGARDHDLLPPRAGTMIGGEGATVRARPQHEASELTGWAWRLAGACSWPVGKPSTAILFVQESHLPLTTVLTCSLLTS
jgi:hypothetical protein